MLFAALALLIGDPATCVFDTAPPEPCTIGFAVAADGTTRIHAEGKSGHKVDFSGKRGDGWWSGTLDGKPAMGHELNRGNVVFATRALDHSFQYWTHGNEHGTY